MSLHVSALPSASPPAWRFGESAPPADVAAAVAPLPASSRLFAPVCVPFYSERGASLRRSLAALALQQEDLGADGGVLHVFALGDGWSTPHGARILSESMLAELEALYDAPLEEPLGAALAAAPLALVQRLAPDGALAPVMVDVSAARRARARDGGEEGGVGSLPLFLTVLVKRHNRKKSDSHAWFFGVLAPLARLRSECALGPCELYFITDAGTLFAPRLLARLAAHLASHPRAGAATGHQRIMHSEDQADPVGAPVSSTAAALRCIQGYDFESELCLFNGAHALAGFLPVIPGPCGAFRASALSHGLVTTMRNVFSSGAAADGLVLANLKLAEDRVLSYLLLVHDEDSGGGGGWETHWVPSAVFYFEFETTLRELVLQRRRWLNGTTAGLLWLLSQGALLRALLRRERLAWAVVALSGTELLIVAIVFFLPAVFTFTGFIAIGHAAIALEAVGALHSVAATFGVPNPHASLVVPLQIVYIAAAVTSFLLHVQASRTGTGTRGGTAAVLWEARRALGAFVMVTSLAASLALLALCLLAPAALSAQVGMWDVNDIRLSAAFSLHFLATPFCLAALHSLASLRTMVATFPSFFTFFPVISGDFFSYSIARFDDLSWGTKAVGTEAAVAADPCSSSSSGGGASVLRAYASRQALRCQELGLAGGAAADVGPMAGVRVASPVESAAEAAGRLTTVVAVLLHAVLNTLLVAWLIANSEALEHRFALTASLLTGPPAAFAVASFAYLGWRAVNGSSGSGSSVCDCVAAVVTLCAWFVASAAIVLLILRDSDADFSGDGVLVAFFGAYAAFVVAQVLRCRGARGEACGSALDAAKVLGNVHRCAAPLSPPHRLVIVAVLALFAALALLSGGASSGVDSPVALPVLRARGPVARPLRDAPLAAGARILEYLHSRGEALALVSPAPVRAVYIDARDVDWGDPCATVLLAVNASFNVVNLAFAVGGAGGETDMLGAWLQGGAWDARHNATVAAAHARGAVVLLAAGGATDVSYFSSDAAAYGTSIAHAALAAHLDGIEFDLEGFGAGCSLPGLTPDEAVAWVVRATRAARLALGPLPLITHAPLAAYFSAPGGEGWAGDSGCYSTVYARARDAASGEPDIDWLNVQFYNSGQYCYGSFESLFLDSARGGWYCFPGTAVAQIASYGVPLPAIVVGKITLSGDADSGFVAAPTLAAQVQRAGNELAWRAGVSLWEWQLEAAPAWARALA